MKKRLFILAVLACVLFAGAPASAATFVHGENYTLPSAKSVGTNLYAAGGNLNILGAVSSDLFSAGGTLNLSGKVGKDLFAAGGNINISGDVGEDLHAVGGSLVVDSRVAGETMLAGGQIIVQPDAVFDGKAYIAGGAVVLNGLVNADTLICADTVEITGTVNGNLQVKTQKLIVADTAVVNGVLAYKAPKETVLPAGARIKDIQYSSYEKLGYNKAKNGAWVLILVAGLIKLLSAALVALVLFLVLKKGSTELILGSLDKFWTKVLTGFVVLVVLPIAGVILAVTLLGLPFTFMAALVYVLFSTLAVVGAGAVFGTWLFSLRKKGQKVTWVSVFVGVLLLGLVGIIPVIGWAFAAVFFLALFGQLFWNLYGVLKRAR